MVSRNGHEAGIRERTIVSRTPSSLNSDGTFTSCASAARIYCEVEDIRDIRARIAELTVSRMPEALGFPSRRIGLPPMNLDNFWSKGSRVVFQAAAAAEGESDCTLIFTATQERYLAQSRLGGSQVACMPWYFRTDSHLFHSWGGLC